MDEKGQAAVEIILIAVVLLGLLLATVYVMVQRNNDISRISAIQRDTLKCDGIASIITSFASNSGYSETVISGLEKDARIEKGSIIVGETSCGYKGDVWLNEITPATGPPVSGFDLIGGANGKSYTVKTFKTESGTQGVSFYGNP